MVLDIGARKTIIHPDYAEELGLEVSDIEQEGATAHGAFSHSKASKLDKFELAGKTRENLDVMISEGVRVIGDEIGVIGANFLDDFCVEIDYANKEFFLRDQKFDSNIPLIPFTPNKAKGKYLVVVDASINDSDPFPFIVDTGAGGSLINMDIADSLSLDIVDSEIMIRSPTGTTQAKTTKVNKFETPFGSFSDQNFLLMPLSHLSNGERTLGGIIGFNFLMDKKLLIDYPNSMFTIVG